MTPIAATSSVPGAIRTDSFPSPVMPAAARAARPLPAAPQPAGTAGKGRACITTYWKIVSAPRVSSRW